MTVVTTEPLPPVLALPAPASPSTERIIMSDASEQSIEQVDPKGMTFMQMIGVMDQGQIANELNTSWNELIRTLLSLEVNEGVRKSKGSLSIKIGVEYEDGTVKLKVEEKITSPKAPQRASVFWVTGDGRVTPENPRQMSMFRDVPRRPTVIVS